MKNFKVLGGSQNYGDKDKFEIVDCSSFFKKIVTTFPNLNPRWETFGGMGGDKLKEWLRMGGELGLRVGISGDENCGEEDILRELLDLTEGKSCILYVKKM